MSGNYINVWPIAAGGNWGYGKSERPPDFIFKNIKEYKNYYGYLTYSHGSEIDPSGANWSDGIGKVAYIRSVLSSADKFSFSSDDNPSRLWHGWTDLKIRLRAQSSGDDVHFNARMNSVNYVSDLSTLYYFFQDNEDEYIEMWIDKG
ncbi:TPA: hypothetical protein ACX6PV_000713 [Photobacterium damselae]